MRRGLVTPSYSAIAVRIVANRVHHLSCGNKCRGLNGGGPGAVFVQVPSAFSFPAPPEFQ
nr:MAG TPA: hypothetical protein [Caudoviricetes sp.]